MGSARRFVLLAVLLAVFALNAQPAAAAGITIQADQACAVTPGHYSIGVTNDQEFSDTFRITAIGPQRSWVIFDGTSVKLASGGSGTFELTAAAPQSAPSGFYYIPVTVYSDKNDSVQAETSVCLIIKRVDRVVITGVAFADDSVGPGETLKLTAVAENVGTEEFRNVEVEMTASGPQDIQFESATISLSRGETETIERQLEVTKLIKPGQYTLRITLTKDEDLLDTVEKKFTIEAIDIIDKNIQDDKGILSSTTTTVFTNRGNTESTETVTAEVAKPFNVFTDAPGAAVSEQDGKVLYTWTVTLKPGESETVTHTVRYWPFYIILLVVLAAAYQIYIISKRPNIRKLVLSSRRQKDDIQEFAIAVEIKNTTPTALKNVVVRDFVPAVARVFKDFKVQPERAKFVEAGTELVWRVKEMKRGETRMFHYKIATTVGAVDSFVLPSAIVEGMRLGREYRVHSNEMPVGSRKNVQ
ncbi:MAG: hypothetical protein HYS81_00155 [Candidatus Aenigmatarchaeota archaeon]|nr:MAG: hypothetical protein HYS81_00155 [Candidatus Aenigmarchaeota archaeon]